MQGFQIWDDLEAGGRVFGVFEFVLERNFLVVQFLERGSAFFVDSHLVGFDPLDFVLERVDKEKLQRANLVRSFSAFGLILDVFDVFVHVDDFGFFVDI